MAGKSSAERQAIEAITARILPGFLAAGFEHIEPDILQPADIFLDRSGEDIRSRTFVFTDPAGRELCLRPDLTVPACRYHLSHAADPEAPARYCYAGKAFRFQPGGGDRLHPAEFDQTGIELIGAGDAEAGDAEVLRLALQAVAGAGLARFRVTIGDLGLFAALLSSIPMPERWRRRLAHQFWRPRAFRALIDELTGARTRPRTSISPLLDRLAAEGASDVEGFVARHLEAEGLEPIAGRTVADIAGRLAEKLADRAETPLAPAGSLAIDRYLAVRGTPEDAAVELRRLAGDVGGSFAAMVERFCRRNRLMAEAGVATGTLRFSSVFGRSLEYYTGFVFQIEVDTGDGGALPIAGGGRYDGMLSDLGAPRPIPAVGCAIHTERLLAAVTEAAA
jgi:ATP phosphoribosyltransferase regulatory subunit